MNSEYSGYSESLIYLIRARPKVNWPLNFKEISSLDCLYLYLFLSLYPYILSQIRDSSMFDKIDHGPFNNSNSFQILVDNWCPMNTNILYRYIIFFVKKSLTYYLSIQITITILLNFIGTLSGKRKRMLNVELFIIWPVGYLGTRKDIRTNEKYLGYVLLECFARVTGIFIIGRFKKFMVLMKLVCECKTK